MRVNISTLLRITIINAFLPENHPDVSISVSEEADSGYPEMADDIPSMSRAGFFIRNARRIRLEHVEVTGQVGEAFDVADCENVTFIK